MTASFLRPISCITDICLCKSLLPELLCRAGNDAKDDDWEEFTELFDGLVGGLVVELDATACCIAWLNISKVMTPPPLEFIMGIDDEAVLEPPSAEEVNLCASDIADASILALIWFLARLVPFEGWVESDDWEESPAISSSSLKISKLYIRPEVGSAEDDDEAAKEWASSWTAEAMCWAASRRAGCNFATLKNYKFNPMRQT